ncbi:MAG: hypothetical protein AAF724_07640 [Pseudomonadota bacterium]
MTTIAVAPYLPGTGSLRAKDPQSTRSLNSRYARSFSDLQHRSTDDPEKLLWQACKMRAKVSF